MAAAYRKDKIEAKPARTSQLDIQGQGDSGAKSRYYKDIVVVINLLSNSGESPGALALGVCQISDCIGGGSSRFRSRLFC